MTDVHIKIADSDEDVKACHEVMVLLGKRRASLSQEQYFQEIQKQQKEGYVMAYLEDAQGKQAVAGYRYANLIAYGKMLYLDDLVVREEVRSKGYGGMLIDWLEEQAIKNDCDVFNLTSGTERDKAHKFYFQKGFHIDDFHFCKKLKND